MQKSDLTQMYLQVLWETFRYRIIYCWWSRISIGGMFIPTLKYRIDLDTILPVGYAQEVSISELNDFFDANLMEADYMLV